MTENSSSDQATPTDAQTKVAIIIGIGSRRGLALARYLSACQQSSYELHSIVGWQDVEALRQRFADLLVHVTFHTPNMNDANELLELIRDEIRPDEIYNLHLTSVQASSPIDEKQFTFDTATTDKANANGTANGQHQDHPHNMVEGIISLRLVDALRCGGLIGKTKLFQEQRVDETSFDSIAVPCRYQTPNACSKLFSHWTVKHARESHGLYAVNGSFFEKVLAADEQHPASMFTDDILQRLSEQFIQLRNGSTDSVHIELHHNETIGTNGDINKLLDRCFEFAHVDDLAEAMWLSLNAPDNKTARDYVFATGQFYSIRQFCEEAFAQVKSEKSVPVFQWREVTKRHVVATNQPTGVKLVIKFAADDYNDEATSASADSRSVKELVLETRKWLKWEPKHSFAEIVAEYLKWADAATSTASRNNGQEAVSENNEARLATGSNLLMLEE